MLKVLRKLHVFTSSPWAHLSQSDMVLSVQVQTEMRQFIFFGCASKKPLSGFLLARPTGIFPATKISSSLAFVWAPAQHFRYCKNILPLFKSLKCYTFHRLHKNRPHGRYLILRGRPDLNRQPLACTASTIFIVAWTISSP